MGVSPEETSLSTCKTCHRRLLNGEEWHIDKMLFASSIKIALSVTAAAAEAK
jgi:hypothetical protein